MATSDDPFTYYFNGTPPSSLICNGDAHFPADTTDDLRLTKTDTPPRCGHAIRKPPIQFWRPGEQISFKTTVKFSIKPESPSNKKATTGFSFFLAPVNDDSNPIHVAEFNVHFKDKWNPSRPLHGIEIELRVSDNVCQIPPSIIEEKVTLTISYDAATNVICATIHGTDTNYNVRKEYNLSSKLPEGKCQVGLAASTSACDAICDVSFWDFTRVKK